MDKFLYNYFRFNENHIKNQSAILIQHTYRKYKKYQPRKFPLLRQQHKVSSPNRKSKHERGERRNMGVDLERLSEKERPLSTT